MTGYLALYRNTTGLTETTPQVVPAETPGTQPAVPPEPLPEPVKRASEAAKAPAPIRPAKPLAKVPEQRERVAAAAPVQEPQPLPPAQVAAPPTPVPVAAEPPRYVPDPPLPGAAEVMEQQRVQFEELTVEKHSVIGIRLDEAISTRTARVEDRVSATVSRDVTVAGRIAIPAGVRLEGNVVLVERGGKFRDRPRLGLRFDRMILTDGTRVSLKTDTIYREGDSPSADATAKVGTGAVAGAILGGLLGGKKGAAIGTAAGAAGGAATVMRGDGNESSLPAGAPLTVRLTEDVTVTIQR